jgi:hypothetical protein
VWSCNISSVWFTSRLASIYGIFSNSSYNSLLNSHQYDTLIGTQKRCRLTWVTRIDLLLFFVFGWSSQGIRALYTVVEFIVNNLIDIKWYHNLPPADIPDAIWTSRCLGNSRSPPTRPGAASPSLRLSEPPSSRRLFSRSRKFRGFFFFKKNCFFSKRS